MSAANASTAAACVADRKCILEGSSQGPSFVKLLPSIVGVIAHFIAACSLRHRCRAYRASMKLEKLALKLHVYMVVRGTTSAHWPIKCDDLRTRTRILEATGR